jgi:hypothetical protein
MEPTTAIVPASPMSVVHDAVAKGFRLVNDEASPGNMRAYGTNAAGVKGWYSRPAPLRTVLEQGDFTVTADQLGGEAATTGGGSGEYTITFGATAYPLGLTLEGSNVTLNASLELVLTIVWTSAVTPRRWSVQVYDAQNGALADQHGLGIVHTQTATGATTVITIPGLAAFGAAGFIIELR